MFKGLVLEIKIFDFLPWIGNFEDELTAVISLKIIIPVSFPGEFGDDGRFNLEIGQNESPGQFN
jgi:hypothetical protein